MDMLSLPNEVLVDIIRRLDILSMDCVRNSAEKLDLLIERHKLLKPVADVIKISNRFENNIETITVAVIMVDRNNTTRRGELSFQIFKDDAIGFNEKIADLIKQLPVKGTRVIDLWGLKGRHFSIYSSFYRTISDDGYFWWKIIKKKLNMTQETEELMLYSRFFDMIDYC